MINKDTSKLNYIRMEINLERCILSGGVIKQKSRAGAVAQW